MSRRSKIKYPALRREYNTKSRHFFIETDYINGVKNDHGRQVLRPLTEEEKEWLNKFYDETVNANFKRDGSDFYKEASDRKILYHENYIRNVDLYNLKQRTGMLKINDNLVDLITKDPFYFLNPEDYIMKMLDSKEEDKD